MKRFRKTILLKKMRGYSLQRKYIFQMLLKIPFNLILEGFVIP